MSEEGLWACIYKLKELYCELDKAHSEILHKQIQQEKRLKLLEVENETRN